MGECPVCGSAEAPKFESNSAWCEDCVTDFLDEQLRLLEDNHQEREIIDFAP